MPTSNASVTNPMNNAAGASVPTGEDGGRDESEPVNESKKATLNAGSGANNALQIPKSDDLTSTNEIKLATPAPIAARRPAVLQSPDEAVQSWVKAQNAHLEDPATASPVLPNWRSSISSQKSDKVISRPPSAAGSASGDEHKFSLKDLLGSGRRSSRRNSASSKGSSWKGGSVKGGSQKGGSTAGETAALGGKYGVYGKIAVGKGATSIVRLAHKWDRTEDKLYAVKVSSPLLSLHRSLSVYLTSC
jgi:protein-serine/threonine kinase